MKRHLMTLAVAVALCSMSTMALAQAEPGDIGIFFDPAGTTTVNNAVAASVPFFFYVVGFDIPGDVFGYEFSISNTLAPGLLFILSALPEPIATATNFGSPENWIVGTGVCLPAQGATVIGTVNALALVPPVDLVLCLGPSSPSSFLPAAPGYVSCLSATDLRVFGVAESGGPDYPDGCAVANPTGQPPVANDSASWGSLKANFND